jgi:hypothetical protein
MLTFTINSHEKFVIHTWSPDDIIHCCYQSHVSLFINETEFIIGKSIVADFAERLEIKLKLVLVDKLKLHKSIKKNIGYYWNQELNEDNPNLHLMKGKESSYWVGHKYLLWATDSNKKYERFSTWLYNDDTGNIIFEVTPTYPETFIDPEDPAEVKAYQEWMEKSYKPFFTRIIPKDIAEQWLKQAELILKTIQDNVKKLEDEV